ncbi:serine/threonine protein kinase [Bacillus sp. Marseille-P3661]|uniref:serine/threonine protein kinase n=1 Tax=Bacillus sp. Marseille-P3661 TaxID=1936234 RepID=UPI000C82428B|nr:protein kinase [Bacillus sp. Marseille-P3661]
MVILLNRIKSFILDRPIKKGNVLKERYRIIEVIGEGSYGITYLATDISTNTSCVLKQIKPSRRKLEHVTKAFSYEKRILSMLNHPQIPSYRGSLNHNGHQFLIMDYVPGCTFEELIFNDGKHFDELMTFNILQQIVEVIQYCHELNIIHRDLRIPNILFNKGKIFIVDFGLARFTNTITHDENNRYYEIEKQLRREIHPNSDFYALGHFALFLLYSTFNPQIDEEKSWEEELQLTDRSRCFLRKLLQLEKPYLDHKELNDDLTELIQYINTIS